MTPFWCGFMAGLVAGATAASILLGFGVLLLLWAQARAWSL